jgi:hypothetical protein
MYALRPQRPESGSLSHATRDRQGRNSRTIERSTLQIAGIISSNSQSKKKKVVTHVATVIVLKACLFPALRHFLLNFERSKNWMVQKARS